MSQRRGTLLLLIVLVGGVAGPVCIAGDDADAGPASRLQEAQARSILAEGLRCSPKAMGLALRLGYKFTVRIAEKDPRGAGLALLLLAYEGHIDDKDLRVLSRKWQEAPKAMLPPGHRRGDEIDPAFVLSLLREPFLKDVTVEHEGEAATGTVTFHAPSAYEGRFAYTARRVGEDWRIVELRLPHSQIRVAIDEDRTTLHLPDWMRSVNPHRGRVLTLPEVGVVGRDPEPEALGLPVIVLSVTRDGRLISRGAWSALSLAKLRNWLRMRTSGHRYQRPDGRSQIPLLLDVDEETPWIVCQWILALCADRHVGIDRVYFGATAKGTGEAGAIACFPNRVRRPRIDPPRGWFSRDVSLVEIRPGWREPIDWARVWHSVRRFRARLRGDAVFHLRVPPGESGHLPAGAVLRVIDLLQQAGVGRLVLEAVEPPAEALWDADALAAFIRKARDNDAKVAVTFNGSSGERKTARLRTGGRVDRFVGFGTHPSTWGTAAAPGDDERPGAPLLTETGDTKR